MASHVPPEHPDTYVLTRRQAVATYLVSTRVDVTVDDFVDNDLERCLFEQALYGPRWVTADDEAAVETGAAVVVRMSASERFALRSCVFEGAASASFDTPGTDLRPILSVLHDFVTTQRTSSGTASRGAAPADDVTEVLAGARSAPLPVS